MIARYWGDEMRALWEGSEKKFSLWRDVELAVLDALASLRMIPSDIASRVRNTTWMDSSVARMIEAREHALKHDLNAFLDIMRAEIIMDGNKARFEELGRLSTDDPDRFQDELDRILAEAERHPVAGAFHDGMTSYDTEEPAMALLLCESCHIIANRFGDLHRVLARRARDHHGQLMLGRTHGQHAQPTTFGIKCLNWLDMVDRSSEHFHAAAADIKVMKLSGAVGVYGTLPPEAETGTADFLGLTPVIATQILPLDRRVRLVSEMALTAGVLEKIAHDLWLLAQTEVGEIREPFGRRQKGSSAMPHKKNPVSLENVIGCADAMRGYAAAMMGQIATSHERDIAHSSVERMVVPDAFGILDHMFRRLTAILKDMIVFPERMRENLDMTFGVIASQRVEQLLKMRGMGAEDAYRTVQESCAAAQRDHRHLLDILLNNEQMQQVIGEDGVDKLSSCFTWEDWVKHENYLYDRAIL